MALSFSSSILNFEHILLSFHPNSLGSVIVIVIVKKKKKTLPQTILNRKKLLLYATPIQGQYGGKGRRVK